MSHKLFVMLPAVFYGLLVFSPISVFSATAEETQVLLQKLQLQIADLQKQLMQIQSAGWCHNFDSNLGIGSKGAEVSALKMALTKEGILSLTLISSEFDRNTASYVTLFQQKYKNDILTPFRLTRGNGYVGKLTRAKLNKLYGCAASQVPAVVPSVTVVSPNGLEQLSQGGGYYIKWNSQGLDRVNIVIVNYVTGEQLEIGTSLKADSGQYFWTVPYWLLGGTKYKITVKSGQTTDLSDNYFSITAVKKALTPSITLLSPDGGERWEKGKTYSIKWLYQDLDRIDAITLYDFSKNESYYVGYNIGASHNSFDWQVPSDPQVIVEGSQYKIRLESCVGSSCYSDQSSNYFTIASP